jgi:hypothetical protein
LHLLHFLSNACASLSQRHAKPALAKVERPQVGLPEDVHDTQETNALVKQVYQVLKQQQRVPFVNLVLDYDSFAHTAENMFSLSFLVR